MRLDLLLDSLVSIKPNYECSYSSLKASNVVGVSFELIRLINKLRKDCWDDLSVQFAIYRKNLSYYRKFGGTCPTLECQLAYKEKINKLNDIKETLLTNIENIKKNNWTYDIGYCKYIRGLRDILKLNI